MFTDLTTDHAKELARKLRIALATRGHETGHSEALELVAAQLGYRDWNTASALLGRAAAAGPRFIEQIPVLRSLDELKCRSFYCGFLGFHIDFEHRFAPHLPLYLGLIRGPVKLHLSEHPGDARTGSATFVWMNGIDDYHRELAASNSGHAVPEIVDQPWGREINLADPFGNRLRFCERPTSAEPS